MSEDKLTAMIAQAFADPKPAPPVEELTKLQEQWEREDEDRRRQAAPFQASGYLEQLGFPRENLGAQWGDRVPGNCRERLSEYADGLLENVREGVGLFLGAGIGAGKTSMLALVALRALQTNLSCAYVLAGWELVEACGENKHPFADVSLLLLDDLDYVSVAGFDGELRSWDAIGKFLYRRFATGGAVCIASNLPFGELTAKPAMDRVKSRCALRLPRQFRLQTTADDQRNAS